MKRRSLFVFGLVIACAGFAVGQARSLTNADLEKYRSARLKAEQDYRDNYARWGFPSPEELDRQREQSRRETFELAARLRIDALERERIDAEREASERFVPLYEPQYQQFGSSVFLPNYYWSNIRRGSGHRRGYTQPGYFAGGQFWPTGASTPARPMIRVVRR